VSACDDGAMSDLHEGTVIAVGRWDSRFAVVRAVRTLGDRAAAVVDVNGDGALGITASRLASSVAE
jgi:hypothetical protein